MSESSCVAATRQVASFRHGFIAEKCPVVKPCLPLVVGGRGFTGRDVTVRFCEPPTSRTAEITEFADVWRQNCCESYRKLNTVSEKITDDWSSKFDNYYRVQDDTVTM